jgi:hypothetical protein
VLAAGIAVPAVIATGAMASTDPTGGQAATQLSAAHQDAKSSATSFQVAPSFNIEIAVLSKDSNNGNVTQAPQSQADSAAVNPNSTNQDASQKQQDPSQDPPSQAQPPGSSQVPSQAQSPGSSQVPSQAQSPGSSQVPSQAQSPGSSQAPSQSPSQG